MTHLGRWLSALVDGELDEAERDHVLNHLARCESCLSEVTALRALKRRMGGLGETSADSAMTNRLMDLADSGQGRDGQLAWSGHPGGPRGSRGRPGDLRDRYRTPGIPGWALVASSAAVALAAVGAAAFLLGGTGSAPAPRITPAVDVYWTQHGFDTGQAPARPGGSAAPNTGAATGPGAGTRPLP